MSKISDEIAHIKELIDINSRHLHRVQIQIAQHGGDMNAPPPLLEQRYQFSQEIERLKTELRDLEAQHASQVSPGSSAMPSFAEERLPPIRVFISFTPDMDEQQQVVQEKLARFTWPASHLEATASQSASSEEVKLILEQSCDIFLGLYGGRYGQTVPGDGRSITEIEYHTARQLAKPMLLYHQTNLTIEPAQAEFLDFIRELKGSQTPREFHLTDTPGQLGTWIEQDIQAELEYRFGLTKQPERQLGQMDSSDLIEPDHQSGPALQPTTQRRVLLASLGHSPGVVIGLYHALMEVGKLVTQVVTFSTHHAEAREAHGICRNEFAQLDLPYNEAYFHHYLDVEDIESEGDAREFKGMFARLLEENLAGGVEVLVGITGGPTVMGALMAIVVQTSAPERVSMYHLDVDEDIESDGRLPELWQFQYTPRWQELLSPPRDKRRLVQVPYVRFSVAEDR